MKLRLDHTHELYDPLRTPFPNPLHMGIYNIIHTQDRTEWGHNIHRALIMYQVGQRVDELQRQLRELDRKFAIRLFLLIALFILHMIQVIFF